MDTETDEVDVDDMGTDALLELQEGLYGEIHGQLRDPHKLDLLLDAERELLAREGQ